MNTVFVTLTRPLPLQGFFRILGYFRRLIFSWVEIRLTTVELLIFTALVMMICFQILEVMQGRVTVRENTTRIHVATSASK